MGIQQKMISSNSVELEGVLERITFYNEENGFLIGKLKGAKEKRILLVVGKAPKVQCGETLVLSGFLDDSPQTWKAILF